MISRRFVLLAQNKKLFCLYDKIRVFTTDMWMQLVQQPKATSTAWTDAEIVAYPQADGLIRYAWKGGKLAAVKLDFLEQQGISAHKGHLSLGSLALKVVGFDDVTMCLLCTLSGHHESR